MTVTNATMAFASLAMAILAVAVCCVPLASGTVANGSTAGGGGGGGGAVAAFSSVGVGTVGPPAGIEPHATFAHCRFRLCCSKCVLGALHLPSSMAAEEEGAASTTFAGKPRRRHATRLPSRTALLARRSTTMGAAPLLMALARNPDSYPSNDGDGDGDGNGNGEYGYEQGYDERQLGLRGAGASASSPGPIGPPELVVDVANYDNDSSAAGGRRYRRHNGQKPQRWTQGWKREREGGWIGRKSSTSGGSIQKGSGSADSDERRRSRGGRSRSTSRRRRFPRANRATLDFNEELKSLIRSRPSGVRSAHGLLLSVLSRDDGADADAVMDHWSSSSSLKDNGGGGSNGDRQRIDVNTVAFATVINGWARSSEADAGDKATELLALSSERYANGNVGSRPNARVFSGTIRAITRSGRGTTLAAKRAEALLRTLERLHMEEGGSGDGVEGGGAQYDDDLMPDGVLFTTVMNAWAEVRDFGKMSRGDQRDEDDVADAGPGLGPAEPIPAERAESLLRRMDRLHRRGLAQTKPDAVAYCTAIKAWANAASYGTSANGVRAAASDPAERAENLLRELESRYAETSDPDLKPDAVAYTSVIRAWTASSSSSSSSSSSKRSRRGGLEEEEDVIAAAVAASGAVAAAAAAAERAERLLLNVESRYDSTLDPDVKPDAVLYGSVMDAWAEAGTVGCSERAAAILRRMSDRYRDSVECDDDCKPDAVAYTALIKALASDAASRKKVAKAAVAVEVAVAGGSSGGEGDEVTAISMAAKAAECAERAERILKGMEARAIDDPDLRPDKASYRAAMEAWAGSGAPTAGERAEAILAEMATAAMETATATAMAMGTKEMSGRRSTSFAAAPDASHYAAAIRAWALSGSPGDGGEAAVRLLEDMTERYRDGDGSCRPTEEAFRWALEAVWSGNGTGAATAAERVEELRRMASVGRARTASRRGKGGATGVS